MPYSQKSRTFAEVRVDLRKTASHFIANFQIGVSKSGRGLREKAAPCLLKAVAVKRAGAWGFNFKAEVFRLKVRREVGRVGKVLTIVSGQLPVVIINRIFARGNRAKATVLGRLLTDIII